MTYSEEKLLQFFGQVGRHSCERLKVNLISLVCWDLQLHTSCHDHKLIVTLLWVMQVSVYIYVAAWCSDSSWHAHSPGPASFILEESEGGAFGPQRPAGGWLYHVQPHSEDAGCKDVCKGVWYSVPQSTFNKSTYDVIKHSVWQAQVCPSTSVSKHKYVQALVCGNGSCKQVYGLVLLYVACSLVPRLFLPSVYLTSLCDQVCICKWSRTVGGNTWGQCLTIVIPAFVSTFLCIMVLMLPCESFGLQPLSCTAPSSYLMAWHMTRSPAPSPSDCKRSKSRGGNNLEGGYIRFTK